MRRCGFLLVLSAILIIGGCGDSTSSTSQEVSSKDTVSQVELMETPSNISEPSPITESTPTSSPAPTKTTSPTTSSEKTPATELSPSPTTEPQAEMPPTLPPEFEPTMANHFGFMPAFYDYTGAAEAGAAWDRPYFEMFTWGWIERQPGNFDFRETDRCVLQAQQNSFHILANVQPKAQWDQEKCHQVLNQSPPGFPAPFTDASIPCDMDQYRDFVMALVERYDGDGFEDMPNLTWPIKHWEIMNEPEFLMYFAGTPEEYFEIVQTTYTAIKDADPDAVVVQGGLAGMMPEVTDFWQVVFDLGGAEYFDVMNVHSIGHGEHLNIPAFKQFLAENDITGKPIWVTEVQFQQSHQTANLSAEGFAKVMARSYIFSLANGVDKLLYVNLKLPENAYGAPFDERSALIDNQGERTPLFDAHLTISQMLGDFSEGDDVETIKEDIGDWFINPGQYKFTIGGKTLYALWGSYPIPSEITGEVVVTDISGVQTITNSSVLKLTDSPVFVEFEE